MKYFPITTEIPFDIKGPFWIFFVTYMGHSQVMVNIGF